MERTVFNPQALDERDCLLLDPLRVEDEGAAPWKGLPLRVLAPPGFEGQAGQLPYLLVWQELNPEQRSQVHELLLDSDEVVAAPMCVGVVRSDVTPGDVRRHLSHLLVPHFPNGERGVFRFYDPVVFVHLDWILSESERTVLFGPVATWTFPVEENWYVAMPPAPGSPYVRFAPGAEVWLRISRIGSLHAVLQSEHAWRNDPTLYGPQVEPWLIKAEKHGLSDRDDVVTFARQGLLRHARFDTHPTVSAALSQCAGHPARYRRLTSLWSDDDWLAIVKDLDLSTSTAGTSMATPNH